MRDAGMKRGEGIGSRLAGAGGRRWLAVGALPAFLGAMALGVALAATGLARWATAPMLVTEPVPAAVERVPVRVTLPLGPAGVVTVRIEPERPRHVASASPAHTGPGQPAAPASRGADLPPGSSGREEPEAPESEE
ncbi:MAG: hypothetical protein QJR14_10515 [Bacillota bacterium]|nr:hypothetical protein [Bacillota bacterium]